MDWMHALVPEEEVYQMLLLFLLGVGCGAIAGLVHHARSGRRKI